MTSMTVHTNKPKGRSKTKAEPDRMSPEGILAYIQKRLKESPPDPNGSDPYRTAPNTSLKKRSSRPDYFRGSPRFPDGISIGGSELYNEDSQGRPLLEDFRPDISSNEIAILEAYAFNRKFVTSEDRKEYRRLRDLRENEIKRFGRQVDTASAEEQALSAVAQVGDPKVKAAMLEAAAKVLREKADSE